MQITIHFIIRNWPLLLSIAGAVIIYIVIVLVARARYGPKDITGNGITIGQAKAFDNRSLTLRIERLSASLEQLKIVNQTVTENLTAVQKHTATQSERSVTVEVKAPSGEKKEDRKKDDEKQTKHAKAETSSSEGSKTDAKPAVALAASDILSDQLNLASQILNLETLYERSLTDRLLNGNSRLQTVLGFQVSITPPAGCENCVAVAEVHRLCS